MKKVNLFVLVLCLLIPFLGFADPIFLSSTDESTGFSIVSDEALSRFGPRLLMRCHIAKMEMNEVKTTEGNFTYLSIPNFQTSNRPGYPNMPMMNVFVEVPFGAELAINIISDSQTEYTLGQLGICSPIIPTQPSHRKDKKRYPFIYNRKAYQKDEYTSYPLAVITEVGVMRSQRLALVQLAPIAYNPVQKKIRVHNDIQFEISLIGTNVAQTAQIKKTYQSPYFSWVKEQVIVPESLQTLENRASYPIVYLIIADSMFANTLAPFINAKIQKGFQVKVAYTNVIGSTKEQIRDYIHNLYKNPTPETPAPSFILFVGDYQQVTSFSGTQGSYVTDLYYADATGDKIPDMFYGRFSAQTVAQLVPQIAKTLEYERGIFTNSAFLKKVVMIAGWDYSHAVEWGWPQINYGIKYYFNAENGFDSVHKFLSSASQQNVPQIREAIKTGACFVNYTAHGSSVDWSDPNFTKNDIASMTNKGAYPLVVGNCCLTSKFETDSFGEEWLRAVDKGAIGYIGGSSYTYWDEDLWWGNGYYVIAHPNSQGLPPDKTATTGGAYNTAFSDSFFSNAAMMFAGNMAVEKSTSPRKLYYWEVYHLMGDPSVMVYWGVPTQLNAVHTSEIAKNAGSIDVASEPNTYIGISMNGMVYGAGVTDATGKATISLKAFETAGIATIQCTKKNRIAYIAEIKVTE